MRSEGAQGEPKPTRKGASHLEPRLTTSNLQSSSAQNLTGTCRKEKVCRALTTRRPCQLLPVALQGVPGSSASSPWEARLWQHPDGTAEGGRRPRRGSPSSFLEAACSGFGAFPLRRNKSWREGRRKGERIGYLPSF